MSKPVPVCHRFPGTGQIQRRHVPLLQYLPLLEQQIWVELKTKRLPRQEMLTTELVDGSSCSDQSLTSRVISIVNQQTALEISASN